MAIRPHARIAMRLYRGDNLELLDGYLMRTPDGQCWALPSPPDHATKPDLRTAYLLEAKHLEELPSTPEEPRLYLYRAVWHAPQ